MNPREPPQQAAQLPLQQQQSQPIMLLGSTSSYATNVTTHPSMIGNPNIPPSAAGFPFTSVAPRPQSKPPSMDGGGSSGGGVSGLNSSAFDGSSPSSTGMRFSIDPAKKKRGRPRKYTPEGNIALGLSTTPISSSTLVGHADSGSGTPVVASEPPKRNRGRPPGSGKKQLDALGGIGGVGFTPHVITVKAGEDIVAKIMSFSQQGPRTVCILSATGAICNVTLGQPAMSGGTVTYEGRFEIISLSGSFWPSENNGSRNRSGGLSVSLAGSDGRVLGGGVAGMLKAATSVQVILGSFISDEKKPKSPNVSKTGPSSASPTQMLNFGAPLTSASPPSNGLSSDSSDENGGSPLQNPGIYGNAGQAMHSMQMYHPLWTGQNPH